MDSSAHGQHKGLYGKSCFKCYARFEAQEEISTPMQSRHMSIRLFFSSWSHGKLQQQQLTDPDKLFELVDEILTSLSVGMIENCFETGFIGWNKLMHQMVTALSGYSLISLTLVWDGGCGQPKYM
jgi:hypothetical protein